MVAKFLAGLCLMALCVIVHATGLTAALRWWRLHAITFTSFWRATWLFVRLAAWLIVLHLLEITAWGVFYALKQTMPDLASGLYFSAVTYTTTGYGDLVLPKDWRLVGAVEALTGILMCGWSTGFFFAVVSGMAIATRRPGSE